MVVSWSARRHIAGLAAAGLAALSATDGAQPVRARQVARPPSRARFSDRVMSTPQFFESVEPLYGKSALFQHPLHRGLAKAAPGAAGRAHRRAAAAASPLVGER